MDIMDYDPEVHDDENEEGCSDNVTQSITDADVSAVTRVCPSGRPNNMQASKTHIDGMFACVRTMGWTTEESDDIE